MPITFNFCRERGIHIISRGGIFNQFLIETILRNKIQWNGEPGPITYAVGCVEKTGRTRHHLKSLPFLLYLCLIRFSCVYCGFISFIAYWTSYITPFRINMLIVGISPVVNKSRKKVNTSLMRLVIFSFYFIIIIMHFSMYNGLMWQSDSVKLKKKTWNSPMGLFDWLLLIFETYRGYGFRIAIEPKYG